MKLVQYGLALHGSLLISLDRAYFWRGPYSEGLMYGGKFAFQNRLGYLVVVRKFTIFALFYFVFEGKFQVQAPRGLIFGGAI